MDRVFLDANVLFSAAWREGAGLLRLWALTDVQLLTSLYAIDEARRNLAEADQRDRLDQLASRIELSTEIVDAELVRFIESVSLAEKDRPILLGAIASGATHLLTGDATHFGEHFGRSIRGVLILRPAAYIALRAEA